MRAELRVDVEDDRVVDLRVDPPLGAKVITGRDGPVLNLIGTAAALLEGDELAIEVRLHGRARLTVRSVAAQVAHPCPRRGSTGLRVRASVGDGAALRWAPEPLILCAQSIHRSVVELDLTGSGTVHWSDEVVLGRSGEDAETVEFVSHMRVMRNGAVEFEDGLALEPAGADVWRGPAVLGRARYLGTRIDLGEASSLADHNDCWMTLSGGGHLLRVIDADPLVGRHRFAEAAAPVLTWR